jgi:hypothetical protein
MFRKSVIVIAFLWSPWFAQAEDFWNTKPWTQRETELLCPPIPERTRPFFMRAGAAKAAWGAVPKIGACGCRIPRANAARRVLGLECWVSAVERMENASVFTLVGAATRHAILLRK